MLAYEYTSNGLGAIPAVPTVAECKRDLHVSDAVCQELINQAIASGVPGGYYIIARMALVGAAANKCAGALQSVGVPVVAGLPACTWAVNKLWQGGAAYFSWGGPTWYSLVTGAEGIYWRSCPGGANDLMPGEHLVKHNGKLQCRVNMAIGSWNDKMRFVYIPCANIKTYGSQGACMDHDGVRRSSGSGDRMPGFYKKKHDGWPSQFDPIEGGRAWKAPYVKPSIVNIPPLKMHRLPGVAPQQTPTDEAKPFYKRGLFWGVVAGATAAAVGGGVAVSRMGKK